MFENNRAILFYEKGDFSTALKWFKKAYNNKKDPSIIFNMGLCYYSIGKWDEAISHYMDAWEKTGDNNYLYDLSLANLMNSDWKKGMELYKYRYHRDAPDAVFFPKIPLKWAESIDDYLGKKVLVLNEQGLGDELFFSRSIEDLSKVVEHADIQVYPELIDLFNVLFKFDNIHFFTDRIINKIDIPKYDLYSSSGEVFRLFNSESLKTIPCSNAITENNNLGFTWAANQKSKNAKERSIDPKLFKQLSKQYKLISLQRGSSLDFCENPQLNTFLDTKKIIDNLELVVTIDSSVVHLSGLLGKETYLVTKNYLDWRWLYNPYESVSIIKNNEIRDL